MNDPIITYHYGPPTLGKLQAGDTVVLRNGTEYVQGLLVELHPGSLLKVRLAEEPFSHMFLIDPTTGDVIDEGDNGHLIISMCWSVHRCVTIRPANPETYIKGQEVRTFSTLELAGILDSESAATEQERAAARKEIRRRQARYKHGTTDGL